MKRGQLYIISGPSGVGKSTIVSEVRARHPEIYFSVSATTRAMRETDAEGVTYLFRTRGQFEQLIREDFFYEYAEYSGNYYGTPKKPVEDQLAQGNDVILEIDVQGALQVKAKSPDAIMIFIAAPSYQVLETRLRGRGDTAEDAMEKRLAQAAREYRQGASYDFLIVNDVLETAISQVELIMAAEKLRTDRNLDVLKLEESL